MARCWPTADIAVAHLPGSYTDAFLCLRVFDQQQLFGEQLAKAAMDFADAFGRDGAALQTSIINPFLNGDMRFRLKLEVAFGGVLAVVVFQGALDVDRVGVVSFNKVAVVAVHRPHEIGERS